MIKQRSVGEVYRPVVKVTKSNQGVPTEIVISEMTYALQSKREEKGNQDKALMLRKILIELLLEKGVYLKRPHEMKINELKRLLFDNRRF